MLAKARVEFRYEDRETAEKIARLLEIDNRVAPRKLKLKTYSEGDRVITVFEHGKLNTFLATIDDLLFSEKLIEGLIGYVGSKPC
ncbi:MAG: KEOPS complex subunit Pcc1 [Candidatus Hydrothermarchaeales archaeon]